MADDSIVGGSLQREVMKDTIVELAYNGNHSTNLPVFGDYNQAAPNAVGGTLGVQARRPIPTFGPITWVDPVGVNDYNGFWLDWSAVSAKACTF